MKDEQRDLSQFNDRLNAWVFSQGPLFHLTHGGSGSGLLGRVISALIKLVVVLALCAAAFWGFLTVKSGGKKAVTEKMRLAVQDHFGAEEVKMSEIAYVDGRLQINSIELTGGGLSFFDSMEIGGFSCAKPPLEFFGKEWDAGQMEIADLKAVLRAGADDDAQAQQRHEQLFAETDGINFSGVTISDADLSWGYGTYTRGSLIGTKIQLEKGGSDSWDLELTGGEFSQTWAQGANLRSASLKTSRDKGLSFQNAELELDGGSLILNGALSIAAIPKLDGTIEATNLQIAELLPKEVKKLFEGGISGKGTLGGSPNGSQGITSRMRMTLSAEQPLLVRSRLPLIEALRSIDTNRSYYKVEFDRGGFVFDYKSGDVEVTDLDVTAESLIALRGQFEVRRPTTTELAVSLGRDEEDVELMLTENAAEETKLTLDGAGKATGADLFSRVRNSGTTGVNLTEVVQQDQVRQAKSRLIVGELIVRLQRNVFSEAPLLAEKYPPATDAEADGVVMEISLAEPLATATAPIAQELVGLSGRILQQN